MLTDAQKNEILNYVVNGLCFKELTELYAAHHHREISTLCVGGTQVDLVRFISRFNGFVTIAEIRRKYGVKQLAKKLMSLCEKGYLVRNANRELVSYRFSQNLKYDSPEIISHTGKTDFCCDCNVKSDLFDELSNRSFCHDCFQKLMVYSNRHNKNWNHVKKRLKERYGFALTTSIYLSIIEQIQNVNIPTFLPKNRYVYDYINEMKMSTHLVVVNGVEIVAVYKNELDKDKSFLITVLPRNCVAQINVLSQKDIDRTLYNKVINKGLISTNGKRV